MVPELGKISYHCIFYYKSRLDQCKELKEPSKGSIKILKTSTQFIATYSCNKGYDLANGHGQRFCSPSLGQDNSIWLPHEAPTCKGNNTVSYIFKYYILIKLIVHHILIGRHCTFAFPVNQCIHTPCGFNATCTVENREGEKRHCVCKEGFIGNPTLGCWKGKLVI